MLTVEDWNSARKPCAAVDVLAEQGDLVAEFDGILFLVQRKCGINNIVCFRFCEPTQTLLKTLQAFRHYLIGCGIIFIRVEGTTRRYAFLKHIADRYGYTIVQDRERKDMNVFYIKLI